MSSTGWMRRLPSKKSNPPAQPEGLIFPEQMKRNRREAELPSRVDTKEFTCPLPQT